uniref:AAA+ ATPase domain-containing protein n=1 Tax=Leersia perrieri TaxID=77586 RepID=A0A0D9XVF6_9ORYZ
METAVQTLVSNVGPLVGKEFKQLRGVGVDVARLRNELATINALLRMQSEADEGGIDHFVREWMKQLREVAYDAEDCVDLYQFRVRSRSGERLFAWSKRLVTTLISRHRLACDIKALRALASSINEQHSSYGFSLDSLRRGRNDAAVVTTTAHAVALDKNDPDQFVVNKRQAAALAEKIKALKDDDDDDKKLKVFSVVGFGGLGKTTMAVEVCRQLETEFQRQAQVAVSQTFTAKDLQVLLRRLLRQITQPTSKELAEQPQISAEEAAKIDTMDVDELARQLKDRLHNKRYLILIDDVWSTASWDAIRSKLPSSKCGSRIIVTTRIHTVAKACSDANDYYIHHMKKLEDDESEQFIFSEDYVIIKDRLLKRWIAEGLVTEKRGLTQMDLAEGYFNELVSRNMIDRATNQGTLCDGIREERCRVHDMMLEILVSKSLEANFVSLVGGQYEGMSYADHTIRRLSIHGGAVAHRHSSSSKNLSKTKRNSMGNGIKGMMMQHVRSLSIFDPEVHNLLDRLGEFRLLRVLDLEDCKGLTELHMKCICKMYLLRFLSLKGTNINVLPSRIGDLEHLQTLDVRQTQLEDLPETIKRLKKLEHLLFSSIRGNYGWMLPKGVKKMKALRQVNKAAVVYDPDVAEEIGELDQLQELAIYVDTGKKMNLEVVEKLASSLSKMYSLRWLEVGNFDCGKWPFKPIMKFLHKVESPRLLRYLRICGCIDKLPNWVESLTDLVEFDVSWTYLDGVQLFNVLYKLPNLRRLTLGTYFIRKGQHMVARSGQPFPGLKELILSYSAEVPPVYRFEEGSMPKLEMIVAYFGDQWKTIDGIEHLKNLKEVHYNGLREKMEHNVKQVEELNNMRDVSEQITFKVRYE